MSSKIRNLQGKVRDPKKEELCKVWLKQVQVECRGYDLSEKGGADRIEAVNNLVAHYVRFGLELHDKDTITGPLANYLLEAGLSIVDSFGVKVMEQVKDRAFEIVDKQKIRQRILAPDTPAATTPILGVAPRGLSGDNLDLFGGKGESAQKLWVPG